MQKIWYHSPSGDTFIGYLLSEDIEQMVKIKYFCSKLWRTIVVPERFVHVREEDYSKQIYELRRTQFTNTPLKFHLPGGSSG